MICLNKAFRSVFFLMIFLFGCNPKVTIFEAARQGDMETVERLLNESGEDINNFINDENLVYIAIDTGNVELLKLLIEKGADLKYQSNIKQRDSAILRAVKRNQIKIVKELLLRDENFSFLELYDWIGLTVSDYIRSPSMLNVLKNVIDEKKLTVDYIHSGIYQPDKKYKELFKSFTAFLFGENQEYSTFPEDFFSQHFFNSMLFAFLNTDIFYLNESNIDLLIEQNKDVSEILLAQAYSIFCIRIGLLFDPYLSEEKIKILDFIYYQSILIGKKIIIHYGTKITLNQAEQTLQGNIKNDWLNLNNESVISHIGYINEKHGRRIFSALIIEKNIDLFYHELIIDMINRLEKALEKDTQVKKNTYLMRELNRILSLGKSALLFIEKK